MNKARLEYEMNLRNVSKSDMCAMLGISRSAFYRKCNGESEFTQSEIQKILTAPWEFFLPKKCPKRHGRENAK